jgi:hypothetical protein
MKPRARNQRSARFYWRSQQNEHKSASQRVELAHPSKEPFCDKKANCGTGSPERQRTPSVPSGPLADSKPRQLQLTGIVEPDGRGTVGTIRILVESVDRHGRSSASLPDGTVLVAASRQLGVFPEVVEDDQGRWSVGLSNEAPTFESREFASAVAAQMRSAA